MTSGSVPENGFYPNTVRSRRDRVQSLTFRVACSRKCARTTVLQLSRSLRNSMYCTVSMQMTRSFVENVVDKRSQQPAKLPCCSSQVVHSEWTSHQPREIGSGAPMNSTVIKSSSTAAERRECCRLCCPIRRRRQLRCWA